MRKIRVSGGKEEKNGSEKMEKVEGVRIELRKLKRKMNRLKWCMEAKMEGCKKTVKEQREEAREIKREIEKISRCVEEIVDEREKI